MYTRLEGFITNTKNEGLITVSLIKITISPKERPHASGAPRAGEPASLELLSEARQAYPLSKTEVCNRRNLRYLIGRKVTATPWVFVVLLPRPNTEKIFIGTWPVLLNHVGSPRAA